MKNNIKKPPVKSREDLLYLSAFYADFCLCPKSVIITTFNGSNTFGTMKICSRQGSSSH